MRTFEISSSGAEETRTLYLIAASDALSQVSYDPVHDKYSRKDADYLFLLQKLKNPGITPRIHRSHIQGYRPAGTAVPRRSLRAWRTGSR